MTSDTGDDGHDGDGGDASRDGDGPPSVDGDDGSHAGDTGDESGLSGDSLADVRTDLEVLRRKLADLEEEVDDRAEREDVGAIREDLDALAERIDERTVHREDLEGELRRYVRKRVRRGHATGWGPYLVLLYGTVMTVAAFYYLGDPWAIFAMFVVWLSTLGMFVFMVVVGSVLGVGKRLGSLRDLLGKIR
ncbi:MAG: hypothetical protein ABEJ85_05460 [Haloarculaceae archaeon]